MDLEKKRVEILEKNVKIHIDEKMPLQEVH